MLSMHSLHSLVIMASWHCLVPLVSGQTEPWMRTPPPPPMPPGATADSFVRQSWMSDDYGYSRYGGKALLLRFELRGSAALASPPARITSWGPTHCSVRPDDSRLTPFDRFRERMQQARRILRGRRRICGWH